MNKTLHSDNFCGRSRRRLNVSIAVLLTVMCVYLQKITMRHAICSKYDKLLRKTLSVRFNQRFATSLHQMTMETINMEHGNAIINKHCHHRSLQKLLYWCNVLLGPVHQLSSLPEPQNSGPINYIIFKYKMCSRTDHISCPCVQQLTATSSSSQKRCICADIQYICFEPAQREIPSERLVLALLELPFFLIFSVVINEHHCNENDALMRHATPATQLRNYFCVFLHAEFMNAQYP